MKLVCAVKGMMILDGSTKSIKVGTSMASIPLRAIFTWNFLEALWVPLTLTSRYKGDKGDFRLSEIKITITF